MTDARSNIIPLPAVRSRRWTSFVAAPREGSRNPRTPGRRQPEPQSSGRTQPTYAPGPRVERRRSRVDNS